MERSLSCKLRPHHSLCIPFFVGKGYSPEFVSHMTAVIAQLEGENPLVQLTTGCDIVCQKCPNRQAGQCVDKDKVTAIDARCLEALGLTEGSTLRWNDLKELARREIIRPGRIPEVCRDCQWRNLCK